MRWLLRGAGANARLRVKGCVRGKEEGEDFEQRWRPTTHLAVRVSLSLFAAAFAMASRDVCDLVSDAPAIQLYSSTLPTRGGRR